MDTVTISKKEYDELRKDSEILQALYANGVDNWDGYSDAVGYSYEDETEEDIYG